MSNFKIIQRYPAPSTEITTAEKINALLLYSELEGDMEMFAVANELRMKRINGQVISESQFQQLEQLYRFIQNKE